MTGKSDDITAAHLDLAMEFADVPVPYDVVRPKGAGGKGDPGGLVRKGESYYGGVGANKAKTQLTIEETQQRLREQRDLNSGKLKPGGDIAIGDSLAQGMIDANKMGGKVRVGAGPNEVLGMIQSYMKENDIRGKNVYIGTGMPNNPAEADKIQEQIKAVKQGGGNPIVIGTGPGTERKPTTGQNEKLQKISKEQGATFTGPLEDMFPGMRKTDPTMGLHLQPEQYKQLNKKFSPSLKPVEDKTPKMNSDKVSSLSKENEKLTKINNNMIAQVLVKNNVVTVSRAGDTQVTVLASNENSSDSILMQAMKA